MHFESLIEFFLAPISTYLLGLSDDLIVRSLIRLIGQKSFRFKEQFIYLLLRAIKVALRRFSKSQVLLSLRCPPTPPPFFSNLLIILSKLEYLVLLGDLFRIKNVIHHHTFDISRLTAYGKSCSYWHQTDPSQL